MPDEPDHNARAMADIGRFVAPSTDPPIGIYRERAHLAAFLAAVYPSAQAFNDPHEPTYAVVYIASPLGQMSWHIHPDDLDLFQHVPKAPADDPRVCWDGHSTGLKYDRLADLITTIHGREPSRTSAMSFADGPGRAKALNMISRLVENGVGQHLSLAVRYGIAERVLDSLQHLDEDTPSSR